MSPNEFSLQLPGGLTIAGKHWPAITENKQALPVLAIHGWLDNCATYNLLAPALDVDVYAVDLPGHGLSSHRPDGVRYHLIDNVDDVLAIAEALGFQQFNLMGHSMGAGISTYVAAIAPKQVNKLVLIEGLGTITSSPERAPGILATAVKDQRQAHLVKKPVYETVFDAVSARMSAVSAISEGASRQLCERGLTDAPGGLTWTSDPRVKMGSAMRLTEDMVLAYLKKIEMPTLLVLAEEGYFPNDDFIKPRLSAVADLTKLRLPGNHHLHLETETYSLVAKAVDEFLAG
ncbi:MAG: alpha/beta hydrolase [Moraxellaceae bacterium]|nr:MAG: alpha/beta hydrolase [Moraxellaceae bacterium]